MTNKRERRRIQRAIARQQSKDDAERRARELLEWEVADAEDFIAELEPTIAPGDIFVTRGYYGHLLEYRIKRIYVQAPTVWQRLRTPLMQVKTFVVYDLYREGMLDFADRKFRLSKFLFQPVHGKTYRKRAVRPR